MAVSLEPPVLQPPKGHQRLALQAGYTASISPTSNAKDVSTLFGRELPCGSGAFQIFVLISLIISLGVFALHYESFRIIAGVMDHWCRRPDTFENLSVLEWKNLAIPLDERGEFSRCSVREPPDAGNASSVVPCTSWEFDLGQFGNNIVSEWNLVCDRSWLIEVARFVYLATCIVSLPVFGVLADRVGRKTVVFITIPVVLIAGVGSSVPNDFQFFVAVRAIVAASTSALLPPMFALFYEVTPASRIAAYIAVASLSVLAAPLVLFLALSFRVGWGALQLMLMVPTLLLVLLYYGIDESPAWLLATGKAKEAERVAVRAASLNKASLQFCKDLLGQRQWESQPDSKAAVKSTGLCGSRLRTRTVLLAYLWTALSYANDTFVVNEGVPASDVAVAVGYVVSAMACFLAVPFLMRFGFRSIVVASGLCFSTLSAVFAITYSQDKSMMQDCLVIFMRVTGSICFISFISQALGAYPIITHCRGAALNLAFLRFGDALSQTTTKLLKGRHNGLRLAVAAALLALFVIGAQVLPHEDDWVLQGRSTFSPGMSPLREQSATRVMQDTLIPLPKEPKKHRSTLKSGTAPMPPEPHQIYSIQKTQAASLG